jgi:hypothetical protein
MENLTKTEVSSMLDFFQENPAQFSKYSSLIVIVSGHGTEHGFITNEGIEFDFKEFAEQICKASGLKNKPKMIIYACCRGPRQDHGIGEHPPQQARLAAAINGQRIPTHQDTLIYYASAERHVAFDTEKNVLLDTFANVLSKWMTKYESTTVNKESQKRKNIYEILTEVNMKVALNGKYIMMPQFSSSLVKNWILCYNNKVPNDLHKLIKDLKDFIECKEELRKLSLPDMKKLLKK